MGKKLNIIPYRKNLVEKARYLRKNSTPGEIESWKGLRKKQVLGYDFDRQKPIDHFIIDFYCKELKLAIEIDGRSHDFKIDYDHSRQEKLESFGITFLRFSESHAKNYTQSVICEIEKWVIQNKENPPLSPPPEGNS